MSGALMVSGNRGGVVGFFILYFYILLVFLMLF